VDEITALTHLDTILAPVIANLLQARTVEDIQPIKAQLEVWRVLATNINAARTTRIEIDIALLRCYRAMGEMLLNTDFAQGKRTDLTSLPLGTKLTRADLPYPEKTQRQWERLAQIPEELFDSYLVDCTEFLREVTVDGAIKYARAVEGKPEEEAPADPRYRVKSCATCQHLIETDDSYPDSNCDLYPVVRYEWLTQSRYYLYCCPDWQRKDE